MTFHPVPCQQRDTDRNPRTQIESPICDNFHGIDDLANARPRIASREASNLAGWRKKRGRPEAGVTDLSRFDRNGIFARTNAALMHGTSGR
jgi:hypothetical protein